MDIVSGVDSKPEDGEEKPPADRAGDPPSSRAAAARGALGRILDWFWCGSAFRELGALRQIRSARALELRRRSRAAIELARLALEPVRAAEYGPHDALGCDLCAQSVYWSLLARELVRGSRDGAPSEVGPSPTLETLWTRADRAELERAAGDAESAEAIGRALIGRTFVDLAELNADEQARLAGSLLQFAEALVANIDGAAQAVSQLQHRRMRRLAIPVVAVLLAVIGERYGLELVEQARDIARAKPWVASSRWPQGGCPSPVQDCVESPGYFFSTAQDDNPWVEFDLGSLQTVSGFRIANRVDCCWDRAIPLVVEVSTWKGHFPSARARWVRLRVPRTSYLHLSGVRLFR
jgi:hypothetical protein